MNIQKSGSNKKQSYAEIWRRHTKHQMEWEPLYTHLIPPAMKKKDYRELMEEIETLVWEWTWDMVHMASEPEITTSQIAWYEGLEEAEKLRLSKEAES